jgi:hypothetical protein
VTVPTRTDTQIDLEEFVNGEIEVLMALDEVHTAQQAG